MRELPFLKTDLRELSKLTGDPSLIFELSLLTPMIGGGVKALSPDPKLPFRPSSIRGAWRSWWRILKGGFDRWDDSAEKKAKEEEQFLFGGVRDGESRASLFRVEVELKSSRLAPAGVHPNAGTTPRVLPDWNLPRDLAYGLFPLQRSNDDRMAWGAGNMPTENVVMEGSFRLKVSVDLRRWRQWQKEQRTRGSDAKGPIPDPKIAVLGALQALYCWLHFGGIGARTRRGFGALEVKNVDGRGWNSLFPEGKEYPAVKLPDWETPPESLEKVLGGPHVSLSPGATLLIGPVHSTGGNALSEGLAALKDFRQGEGWARDRGQQGRPGRSRWPEPDAVRRLRLREPGPKPDFEHKPQPEQWKPEDEAYPRSAFGLPLLIRFKDRNDKAADAEILPAGQGDKAIGERWPSPLILRPQKHRNGVRLVVLCLGSKSIPKQILVRFMKGARIEEKAGVQGTGSARAGVLKILQVNTGSALAAFCGGLIARNFKEITK